MQFVHIGADWNCAIASAIVVQDCWRNCNSQQQLLNICVPLHIHLDNSSWVTPIMQVIKKQMADGVSKRRVGFVSKGAPARQHSEIQTADGETVSSSHICLHPGIHYLYKSHKQGNNP